MERLLEMFRIRGRLARTGYWWIHGIVALYGVFLYVIFRNFGIQVGGKFVINGFWGFSAVAVYFLLLLAALAANARRFHDHNMRAWYLVGFWAAMFVLAGLHQFTLNINGETTIYRPLGDGVLSWVPVAIAIGLWLLVLVKLGFLRGTAGPNRYGPDPLDPTTENA